ncbi:GNAT family N-acetyltransferase [Specibacter cremeus]|uniref:GNAT family N-acetyltransferase n=1 Tax=Specibacter cremeus TaxID=1629051 RepID=UPI000F76B3B8|nr:GNAT family N-acetyltransferase [Specibacter cremeus]
MSRDVTVRPATAADFDAIARITADAYLRAGYFDSAEHPYVRKILQVAERAAVAPILVAERDGAVIGSVTLAVAGDEWADIADAGELEFRLLVVDPAVQRSGAGRAMVEAILDRARGMAGIDAVSLTTGDEWHGAHALYRKLGFSRVPERDWPIPETGAMLRVYRMAVQPPRARPAGQDR